MSSVDLYLKQLQKAFAQGDATEHTHRPALKTLLETAATRIFATNEPKSAERENKPDYIIRRGSSIIGFVEAKDLDSDLKKTLKTPQLKRYLEALPNLIVTNYIDFIWFVAGERRMEISLASINGKVIAPAADAAKKWGELTASFLAEVSPTLTTPTQVAKNLAGQTRLLRDLSRELLGAGDRDLQQQEQAFKTLLVPDLKIEEFADMYAQTAAYGLFTARVFEHTPLFGGAATSVPDSLKDDPFNLEKAAYLIPKANPFLRQFFQHIASPDLNAQLRWLIEQIADSLRYVDMDKVLHRQSKKQGFEDPVFHFYETFLAEYDRALRESRGVYYTPEPVVDYIVRGVDELLKTRFNKPRGLADPSALILDPATGTATFLRKVIDIIYKREVDDGAGGSWPDYVRSKLLPRVFGFELMMAPYTVAHLKLALQLQEQGFQFAHGERLNVFLTNTLDTIKTQVDAFMANWIASENEGAEHIKRTAPVEVVLGNPPYSGESRNKSDYIMDLLKPYKREPDGSKLKEQNSKWINNDYVKFIRFAHDRVVRTGHGIVAFVTSNSFLDGPIFRGMRARLMEDFDEIFIVDLHGNGNKKEETPAPLVAQGVDKNVFDILEGVSITFLVKHQAVMRQFQLEPPPTSLNGQTKSKRVATVNRFDLWGSRDYKHEWLRSNTISRTDWRHLEPEAPMLLLANTESTEGSTYKMWRTIVEILPVNVLGFQSHRDNFAIEFDRERIEQKAIDLREPQTSAADLIAKYGVKESATWHLGRAKTRAQKDADWLKRIVTCSYRPFDKRWAYFDEAMIDRPRRELKDHVAYNSNICLNVVRQTKSASWQHAIISDRPAPATYVEIKDGSTIIPLYLHAQDQYGSTENARANFDLRFLESLATALERETDEDTRLPQGTHAEDVLAYIYAILHAPSYRLRYAEFLKSDFPRIPIGLHADAPMGETFADVWERLLPLGHELIDLHLLRKVPAALRANFPQSGTSEVEKPRYEIPNSPMNPTTSGRVYINAAQYFEGVPPETWTFKVGGYQVCEKWLKDRKGRTLTADDVDHYRNVVAALTRTRMLMREIDDVANGAVWPRTDVAP
jgi:type I restriction-modification system DNA methylase subunit